MHRHEQTLSGGGSGAVLSAGGAQHAACGGRGGRGAVVGVVVVGRRARQDGVAVGGWAAELEPPQVLGVHRLVALQHFDGLVHREPLPLAACGGSRRAMKGTRGVVRGDGSKLNTLKLLGYAQVAVAADWREDSSIMTFIECFCPSGYVLLSSYISVLFYCCSINAFESIFSLHFVFKDCLKCF